MCKSSHVFSFEVLRPVTYICIFTFTCIYIIYYILYHILFLYIVVYFLSYYIYHVVQTPKTCYSCSNIQKAAGTAMRSSVRSVLSARRVPEQHASDTRTTCSGCSDKHVRRDRILLSLSYHIHMYIYIYIHINSYSHVYMYIYIYI